MELSKTTLRHFAYLRWHRSTLLEGVSAIAIRHMNHLMGAMSRLGIQRLKDDKNADRVFDLIHEEQGLPAERNNRHIIKLINTIPWEMYICLLYVELEGYRSASRRDPSLVFGPLEDLLRQKGAIVDELKNVRDKMLHPAKRIDLGDALNSFIGASALVDGHHYQTVFDLQRRLDMYLLWLGSSLAQVGTRELIEAAESGRLLESSRLELLRRAGVVIVTPPPVFNGVFDLSARQTPFDIKKWYMLGLYQEIRLEQARGQHPDFLRQAKTDSMRMLMRSLVFANELVHLIDFEKFRSINIRAELDERQLSELLLDGTPAATEQELQNLVAPMRVSCALLLEPLRLYYQAVEAEPRLRHEAIEEVVEGGGVPTELALFRNLVFHVGGDRDPNDIEYDFIKYSQGVDNKTLPFDLLPLLLDFFMVV